MAGLATTRGPRSGYRSRKRSAPGSFCDKPDLYRLAYDCYAGDNRGKLRTFGNGSILHGVYFMRPGHFGQWEESGRDQGHVTLGMSLGGDVRGNTARLYVDGKEVGKSDDILLSPRQVGDQVAFLGRNWSHPSFDGRV